MANTYRYDNLTNTAGVHLDPTGGYRLSIDGNVKVKGNLCFYKEGTTDSYGLQDLIFIKSLETKTLQLSAANKLKLKLNTTGAITNNSNDMHTYTQTCAQDTNPKLCDSRIEKGETKETMIP